MRSVWESLKPDQGDNYGWRIWEPTIKFMVIISKEGAAGEEEKDGWEELEQILNMSKEEWLAEAGQKKRKEEAEELS